MFVRVVKGARKGEFCVLGLILKCIGVAMLDSSYQFLKRELLVA